MECAELMEQIHYFGRMTKLYSYAPFLTQAEVAKVYTDKLVTMRLLIYVYFVNRLQSRITSQSTVRGET
jgi:hypothetical protein